MMKTLIDTRDANKADLGCALELPLPPLVG